MGTIPLPEELFAPRMSWRPDAGISPIERFGDYDILGCVGRGGMAEILLAREAGTDSQARPVVIKRVLPEIANDPGVATMFRDEARLVMALDHPNICRIYEVGQIKGRSFIAMEWIHGASFADMIDAAARTQGENAWLPASAVAKIIADVANALDYAHRAADDKGVSLRLVHRDVSPQNIMVGFDGQVRLLDFGLAKTSVQSYKTAAGIVKGKLAYLAPEQWQGAGVDGRADLFSLGLCLYEGLTLRTLYKQERPIDVMNAAVNEPSPDPRAVRRELDPRLSAVVAQALQKKPQDRFQTGALFERALSPLVQTADTQGQLRALMVTLFPEQAALGPSLGLLARLPQPAAPKPPPAPTLPTRPAQSPLDPAPLDRSSLTMSEAAKQMRGGHRNLWIALGIVAVGIAVVLYAMGWRFR